MKKYIYIVAIVLLPVVFMSAGKYNFIDKLKQALQLYQEIYPDEKTYLQTDKTYYKPSEKVWYKGFLVNGSDNKPSVTSDVVYIDLIDPWGKIVQHNEHNTLEGTYTGSFLIAANNPGGLYKIRAYTNWMKNWGEEKYYTKELTVQKVITPRMLLKLDFAKRAYGAGDEVIADLKVTDLSNNKTSGSEVKSTVRIGGVAEQTLTSKTQNGEVAVKFNLPKDLDTSDGILQIMVKDKGIEESITRSIPIVLNKIDIQFYPEGGNLIEEVKCKVAFEALNEFGKGADVKGEIIDQSGNKITTFESFHLGMGAFEFTPRNGKTYYAKIIQPQDCGTQVVLPQAEKNGYVLKLNSKNEKKISWDIYCPQENKDITLLGQTQKEIYYNEILKLKKGWNKVDVKTSDFPIGIAVFTLFANEIEKCERLVFINPDKGLHIEIETNKDTYAPMEDVDLTVKTKDRKGEPVAANIGLAVVDEQLLTMADDKQDNLLSYILFSTELKGKIEEPYFYFNKDEPKAKEAIDYLMLTHGWRSFVWKEVLDLPKREITNFAEKISTIYGYVLDENGKSVQTDVYVIETDGKKRIGKVKTTNEGHFVFHDVDYTGNVHVTTRLPNKVFLLNGKPNIAPPPTWLSVTPLDDDGKNIVNVNGQVVKEQEAYSDSKNYSIVVPQSEEKYEFSESPQLDELVVVGYGAQKKMSVAGAVSVVRTDETFSRFVGSSLASQLAGSVPGIMVNSQDGNPGVSQSIRIRGISSQASQGEPLLVLNGIPVNDSYSTALEYLNPEDIESLTVLKNSASNAIYGSRAANGVISIITKNTRFGEKYVPGKTRFGGTTLTKRVFYKSTLYNQLSENSDLKSSTVYWNGSVRTNNNGEAKIKFKNSAQSSTFRITAEGLSVDNGLLGSDTKRIVTEKPFSLDAKTPHFAAVGDQVNLSVLVRNTTNQPMNGTIKININEFSNSILSEKHILIPAKETKVVYFPIEIGSKVGNFNIYLEAATDKYVDFIRREITIRDINFPYSYSFSGNDHSQEKIFKLPDYVDGTLKAEAVVYINVLDELIAGVESIFRVPYGCFEQVSSSTFPNIFALQLLKTTGQNRPEVYKKANEYLKLGYDKLAAYEVKGTGGFEWYGGSPAHEVLSAYGLVEFYEMAKVYDKVDKEKMNRALSFILSRKDNSGGFKQNNGRYGFSGAPKNVNNAYIVYALTETENTSDIDKEYRSSLSEALHSKDLYRMALMANAAYNMKDWASYSKLRSLFSEYAQKEDFSKIKIQSTIVYSYGDAGRRETVAFWLMALLKDRKNSDMPLIEKCVKYINNGRSGGSFGNSQATSICLQALTKYAELIKLVDETDGAFCVAVNDNLVACRDIKSANSSKENKLTVNFTENLKKGQNTIKVEFRQGKNRYPYGVNISWQSKTPPSSGLCPLKLTTTLASNVIKVNETVRLSVKLQNIKSEGLPMSIAVIGIPGGMSLQPWQLKELQEKEVFDFYEIIDDNLVIYYRELGPSETKTINLDLKAEIAGQYKGMASSAYQYYMNEYKYWIDGLSVTIE